MEANGAPFTPLPRSVLHFMGIQSYGYTDQRKVKADVEVTEDRTEISRSESRALANWATTATWSAYFKLFSMYVHVFGEQLDTPLKGE